MDLEEWELLSDDGLVDIHDDEGKMIFSRKFTSDSNNEFNMNYFICPSPKSSQFVDTTKQIVVSLPIQHDHEVTKQVITKEPLDINMLPSKNICENIEVPNIATTMMEAEQDQVSSQVFFKKMKENEYENMKMDSPKSSNKALLSQVDTDTFQFEEKADVDKEMMIKKIGMEVENEENNGGLNLLNGIGAICSFGVAAAATICIMFIGNRQKHKQNQLNQKLRFQIFSDDKRIKQAVHHATKWNEAISGMGGVSVTRAHITVGGYYDAL